MEKPLEMAQMGLKVRWVSVLGNKQGGAYSVSQVDGDQIWHLPACYVKRGPRKRTMASARTFDWEKAALLALVLQPDNLLSEFPEFPWCLLSYCASTGA